MIDYNKLNNELVELLISYEYARINPINLFRHTATEINSRKETALEMYHTDSMFCARIKTLASYIISMVVDSEGE